MNPIQFGILTVSDRCYNNQQIDTSGPAILELVTDERTEVGKHLKGHVCYIDIVPDEECVITEKLIAWSNSGKVDVILTTGGTGFSERDVTPEATKKVIKKEAPGITLAMLTSSLKITSMAMLSRAVCGIRNRTLIINLPGSPKAVKECLNTIAPAIPHAVDLIRDNKESIKVTHENVSSLGSIDSNLTCLKKVPERARESPFPMISVEEALKVIQKSAEVQKSEDVDIHNAHGRILNMDLYSKYDLPPFRASIKDGYAVLASDGKGRRKVVTGIKAGGIASTNTLVPGTCVRVNTGAPIPDDATAVVQVEDTILVERTSDNTEEKEIEITTDVKHGQDIRPIGCDMQKGTLILQSKTKLGGVELGLVAACGYNKVPVTELPTIGVLSTGDELQCPGEDLKIGHIYDSNKITLLSMLKEYGFHPLDMGIAQDNESVMVRSIKRALETVDVLITSGSMSMGDGDMLKPILQHYFNATIHFGRVNMKPGKPTTFATCLYKDRKKYLLCLPGNPVSATVTMHLFALPLLKQLCGNYAKPVIVKAKLTTSYNLDPRPEYARAILKWENTDTLPKAYSTGNQISSKLLSCKNANALLMLPARTAEKSVMREGDVVQAMFLGLEEYD